MAGIDILTKPFRLAFPVLVEPEAGPEAGSKKKYSIVMLFDKDKDAEAIMEIRKALFQAAKDKWGEERTKWPANLRAIDFKTYVSPQGKDGFPIRDGDTVTWDGFPGHFFVKASTNGEGPKARPPFLVDAKRVVMLDRSPAEGGLICRARITASAFEAPMSKGVTFYLSGVQILKDDGVRFSGRIKAEDAFEEWEDADASAAFDVDF